MRLVLHLCALLFVPDVHATPAEPAAAVELGPNLTKLHTIAADSAAHLRDPSSPIFDPYDGLWHFFCTRVPLDAPGAPSGYPGKVVHFFAPTLDTPSWNTSGVVVDTGAAGSFDAFGVFTPNAFIEVPTPPSSENRTWWMSFSGVPDGSAAHNDSLGLASAPSAFGPWTKQLDGAPVFPWDGGRSWCGETSAPARVDEAVPLVVQGRRAVVVKAVCENFTALPMLYEPADPAGWAPPYLLASPLPLVPAAGTGKLKGFEQARVYPGPDEKLHMTGHDHGDARIPHYVSTDGSLNSWKFAGYLNHFSQDFPGGAGEATPVWPKLAVPGDDLSQGAPVFFLTFGGNPLEIILMNATWERG